MVVTAAQHCECTSCNLQNLLCPSGRARPPSPSGSPFSHPLLCAVRRALGLPGRDQAACSPRPTQEDHQAPPRQSRLVHTGTHSPAQEVAQTTGE